MRPRTVALTGAAPVSVTRSVRRTALGIAATLAALSFQPAPARAASYWVGNGGNPPCTHADLQSALDTATGGAGFDSIHLVGPGPFTGPFTLLGSDVEIVGNVGSCGSPSSLGFSTVRAASGARPLTILSGGAGTVRLRRLEVTTQDGTHSGDGGAIWFAGASRASVLELVDSRVNRSTALGDGGGAYVSRGRLVLSAQTQVTLNAANNGGGIAARNGALVELRGGSVLVNTAFLDGGGIYAPDAQVLVENPSSTATTAVVSNLAGRDGGGLWLSGADVHTISGVIGAPAIVASNRAQRGGGLFIDEIEVRLRYAVVAANVAAGEGGGAYLGDDAGLVSDGAPPDEAPTLGGYPLLEGNSAGEGAALHVRESTVLLTAGRIRDHQAGAGGAVVLSVDNDGFLFLHGVVIESNAAPALFGIADTSGLWLEHLSLSGNTLGGIVRWQGSASQVHAAVGIALDETEPFFASFDTGVAPPFLGCIVSRYASPFAAVPPGTSLAGVTIADPEFLQPPRNLRLQHTSPAIDRCPSSLRVDAEGDPRAHDDPHHPNAAEVIADAGADELTVLFADGFESGNRSQWAGAWP